MSVRALARRLVARAVSWLPARFMADPAFFEIFESRGWHATRASFYSPVPQAGDLDRAVFERVSELPGLEMNEPGQLALLEDVGLLHRARFARLVAEQPPGPFRFDPANTSFGGADALTYFSILDRHRPRRVIEIGAGRSTRLAAAALRELARETGTPPATLIAVDPHPDPQLRELPGLTEVAERRAQELPPEWFAELGPDDVLFIDSSHTVKTGSDVVHLFLEVLPRLRPGVLVHVHDIFLPRDYPAEWVLERRTFWNEQYLLQAFLAFNSGFEVLWAGSWLEHHHGESYRRSFDAWADRRPGSVWLRRRA